MAVLALKIIVIFSFTSGAPSTDLNSDLFLDQFDATQTLILIPEETIKKESHA